MAKYTLADFGQQFPDDDTCLLYLFQKRYGHPERTVALRKLLEAKDAAVRAKLAKDL